MTIAVKICGLTNAEAIRAAIAANVEYAGFVYYPSSPRHLSLTRAAELRKRLPAKIKSVSVLVDPDDVLLKEVNSIVKPDFLQLHGKETSKRISAIKKMFPSVKIIKAILLRSSDDIAHAMRFTDTADMLLFDAKPPEISGMLPGGNGLSFDWNLLKGREFSLPWMLSGGLNVENVGSAIKASDAQAVDVSSSVESTPGVKDPALIEAFVKAARAI